jgi:hypothetical protein
MQYLPEQIGARLLAGGPLRQHLDPPGLDEIGK